MNLDNIEQFQVKKRESSIRVPALAALCEEGEEPVWTVRALDGRELGIARAISENQQVALEALLSAATGKEEKAEAIRSVLGLSTEDTPIDVSRRIEMLTMASVKPYLGSEGRDKAVWLCENFPVQFYQITDEILNITGSGSVVGKPQPSGVTQA